jgi:hypothetical protein
VEQKSRVSEPEPFTTPEEPVYAVEAEVVSAPLASTDEQRHRDYAARLRAHRVLKRYQSGFTPNLLPHTDLIAMDAILASKAIIKLLYLSLSEDIHCTVGEQRSAYRRSEHSITVARSSGKLLYQLGGTALLVEIIQAWIPELDRADLRLAWQMYL